MNTRKLSAALLGAVLACAGARQAHAQARTVIVQDGPNVLLGGQSCASNTAAGVGLTAGWGQNAVGNGSLSFIDQTGVPYINPAPLGQGALRLKVGIPGTAGQAAEVNINPTAAGVPINAFASILTNLSYQHNIGPASGAGAALAPNFVIFADLCGPHLVAPGTDEILIYQPALQTPPCLAGATGTWKSCSPIPGPGMSGDFVLATGGGLPPTTTLPAYLAAHAADCGGNGPLFPALPNPAFGMTAGGSASFTAFDSSVDGMVIALGLPLLVANPPTSQITFDFEKDCSAYGGDADGDCMCDGAVFPAVLNADRCPGDPLNTDTDGDGVCDVIDNCPAVANPTQADADSDGIGDACDPCTDTDGDGFGNPGFPANVCATDNCPSVANPTQTDTDGDGEGDACDVCPLDNPNDGDGDGVPTCLDNCPTVANPTQSDLDNDGIGDYCDSSDAGGLSLRRVQIVKSTKTGKDKWSGQAEVDVTQTPNFLSDAVSKGLTIAVSTTAPNAVQDSEIFAPGDCKLTGKAPKNGLSCKNAARNKLRFTVRPSPNFFRVVFTVGSQTMPALPTLANTPLQVTLTSFDQIDRVDSVDNCAITGRRLLCKE